MDQSDRSVGVDYISMFHPNNPPLVLGMLVGCVATDTSSSKGRARYRSIDDRARYWAIFFWGGGGEDELRKFSDEKKKKKE